MPTAQAHKKEVRKSLVAETLRLAEVLDWLAVAVEHIALPPPRRRRVPLVKASHLQYSASHLRNLTKQASGHELSKELGVAITLAEQAVLQVEASTRPRLMARVFHGAAQLAAPLLRRPPSRVTRAAVLEELDRMRRTVSSSPAQPHPHAPEANGPTMPHRKSGSERHGLSFANNH